MYTFTLVNEETGSTKQLVIDALNPPPLQKRIHEIKTTPPTWEIVWSIDIYSLFIDTCKEIGVSPETHTMYVDDGIIEFGWHFSSCHVANIRSKNKRETRSRSFLRDKTQTAIAQTFSWFANKKDPEVFVYTFKVRRSTEQLLDDLYVLLAPHGYSYSLRVWEGNIATGESGWSVCLLSLDENRALEEIACQYLLHTALQDACDKMQKRFRNK